MDGIPIVHVIYVANRRLSAICEWLRKGFTYTAKRLMH
jgi:hypothetical protein